MNTSKLSTMTSRSRFIKFGMRKSANRHGQKLTTTTPFLNKLHRIIQINLDNAAFDVACLAKQMHLSVSQLNRRLNILIGKPAGQLIWELRMDFAANLLAQDSISISQVALEVGFQNQGHFCRSFKRKYKCSPLQFRKKHQR